MNITTENSQDDSTLIKRVSQGDAAAFKTIVKNTERLVAQIIFKMIPVKEDRRDLAQEVYLKAYDNLGSFKFQCKLSTWIGQITYNTCCKYLAKKKLVLYDNIYGDDDNDALETVGNRMVDITKNEPENQLFKKELAAILKIEIDKLSPLYKTLITLYHNEELSYSEIAEITSLPDGTIKSYLFRARNILKNNLMRTYKPEDL